LGWIRLGWVGLGTELMGAVHYYDTHREGYMEDDNE